MQIAPSEFAMALWTDIVDRDDFVGDVPLPLSSAELEGYRTRTRVYRIALVLSVLLTEEQRVHDLLKVRECFEELVFGVPSEASSSLLSVVHRAMQDLLELISPKDNPREFTWARTWFEAIGVTEINPVRLSLFAMRWMDAYTAVTKMVREIVAL
jgi:hypothetical protein